MSKDAHSTFDTPESISASAKTWLIGAGLFAAALTTFIITADYKLSHSTKEKDLSATLYELRTAQSSIRSRVTDTRQTESFHAPQSKTSNPPTTVVSQSEH